MWMRRLVWLVASVALIAGAGVSGPAWADPPAPVVEELARPDWVSATVTARSTGQRVEVLSEKSETGRVWVFPDGSVEEQQAAAAVRFLKEDSDQWRDIDTTLQATSEGVRPVSMPVDVQLGTAGEPAVVFDADAAGEVAFALPDVVLPTPVLDGPTAVYPEVLAGVDLSVEVRSAGFEVLWIVKTPEAATALLEEYGVEGQLRLPTLLTAGGDVTADSGGGVQVQDTAGEVVGSFTDPVMWDTNTETPGEQGVVEPVVMEIAAEPVASGTPVDVVADGGWLNDPERVFPVVIDPTYLMASGVPTFDTFVQQGVTTDQSGSTELKLGVNGSGQVARAFMNFDANLFKGRQVIKASLSLFESGSYNCSARSFSAYDAGLASTSTRWTAQPTIGTKRASANLAAGYSAACPAARIDLDMTAQAKAWSSTSATHVGAMMRADNEADAVSWKSFHSSKGQNKPVIAVHYNRLPAAPGIPTLVGLSTAATQSGVKAFIGSTTPVLQTVVKDDDLDTVKASFAVFSSATATTNPVTLCQSGYVASGGTASCTAVAGLLMDNSTVWVRVTVGDQAGGWSGWGPAQEVRVAAANPMTPTISCPTPNGSWTNDPKPGETCIISMPVNPAQGTSAPTVVKWSINGGDWQQVSKTQPTSGTPNSHGVQIGGTSGAHTLQAVTLSPTGKQSATASYEFGSGKPSLMTPNPEQVTTARGDLLVEALGNVPGIPADVTGSIQWRIKGSNDQAWVTAPDNGWDTSPTDLGVAFTGRINTSALQGEADGSGVTVPDRISTVIQLRVKLENTTGAQLYTAPANVVLLPHAFGPGFPVSDAGTGQVALWTGEFQTSATDVDLATPDGGLSISRVHSTFAGTTSGSNGVFGPGWVSSIDGLGVGVGGSELIDNTLLDGTLVLVDADGTAIPFTQDGTRRTSTAIATGKYTAVGAQAEESGLHVMVENNAAAGRMEYSVVDEFGTITRYIARVAPTSSSAAVLDVLEVTDPVAAGSISYTHNSSGRVTSITAGLPDGVTACPTTGSAPGCRVLRIVYEGGLVKSVTADVNGEPTRTMATYTYAAGKLASVTDTTTGLTTSYTWDISGASPRLASETPPGQDTITYTYTTDGKLFKVTRPAPTTTPGGTAQLAAFVYDITPTNITGLGNVNSHFANLDLGRKATKAFAVFGPDAPITGPLSPSDARWRRAGVWLTDAEGYTLHQARHGAGEWRITATKYGLNDNVISQWDTRGIAAIEAGYITNSNAAATQTIYNNTILDGAGEVLLPAGVRVTDVYEPATMAAPTGSQTEELIRRFTHIDYDQGAPTVGLSLPTRETVIAVRANVGTMVETISTQWTGYDAAAIGAADKTGWDSGQATSTTLDMNGNATIDPADIVTEMRYDHRGRIAEQRKPGSTGNDAATRKTVYWSEGVNARDPECGNQPAWAGYVCKVGPAAPPPGTPLPVTKTTGYRWDGQPTTQIETSGPVVRTNQATFNPTGRVTTTTVSVSGLPGSLPVPPVTITYTSNGQVAGTTSSAGTTTMTYDTWGRQISYTNTPAGAAADTTTTQYDMIGRVTSVSTPKSTTTYTWDGTDATGNPETRGLLTSVTTTSAGFTATATAAYNAHGDLVTEKLPGAITRRTSYGLVGETTGLSYNGNVELRMGQVLHDQPWVAWSTSTNPAGQISREWTPGGAAMGSEWHAQQHNGASYADTNYTYDPAGRLTHVTDRTAPTLDTSVACTVRSYEFDSRGNRVKQGAAINQTGQSCPTAPTIVTRAHDIADRPLTGTDGQDSYTYDALGRQTTIPAADAPNPTDGDIHLEYHHSDDARRIRQGNNSVTYDLDTSGRRAAQTSYTGGTLTTPGTPTETTVNHYTNDSDNPGWITHTKNGQTATTVYGHLVSDGLSLPIITDAAGTRGELALTTPRGDVAATITLTNPAKTATGLDSWTRYTEYGQPTTPAPTGSTGAAGNGYGWLGAHQRTTTPIGITLMGARLYNPTTGLFTSPDPIFGGNETTYGYPNDPVNHQDTSGLWESKKRLDSKIVVKMCSWHSRCSQWQIKNGYRYWYKSGRIRIWDIIITRDELRNMSYGNRVALATGIGTVYGSVIGNVPGGILGAAVGAVVGNVYAALGKKAKTGLVIRIQYAPLLRKEPIITNVWRR